MYFIHHNLPFVSSRNAPTAPTTSKTMWYPTLTDTIYYLLPYQPLDLSNGAALHFQYGTSSSMQVIGSVFFAKFHSNGLGISLFRPQYKLV